MSPVVSSVGVCFFCRSCHFWRQMSLLSPDFSSFSRCLSPVVSFVARCLFWRQMSLLSPVVSYVVFLSHGLPNYSSVAYPPHKTQLISSFWRQMSLRSRFSSFYSLWPIQIFSLPPPPPSPPYPSGLLNTIPSIYLSVSLSLSFCLLFLSLILPLFSYLSFFSSFCFFYFLDPFSFSVCLSLYSSHINISLYLPVSLSLTLFWLIQASN